MVTFEIRPYEERDRPAIEAMAEEVVRDGAVFPFERVKGVLDHWFAPGVRTYVAMSEQGVVGTYMMGPNRPDRGAHVANAGYMVAESARGRGVGHALARHSIETARELGFRAMQFNQVVVTNLPAVRLWQRLGFRIVGEAPDSFRHPTEGLVGTYVMYREL